MTGAPSSTSATSPAVGSGRPVRSPVASPPTRMTSSSTKTMPSFRAKTAPLPRTWNCSCRPRKPLRCGGSPSATTGPMLGRSTSPPMPTWPWRDRRTTSPTRPSPSCSSRPNTLPTSALCWRRDGGERLRSRRFGPRTWPWPMASHRSRRIAPASSAAAVTCVTRPPWTRITRCPAPLAPCSTRCSPFAAGLQWPLAPWRGSCSGRWSHPPGMRFVACVDRHRDVSAFDRAAMMAWTQAQVQLHHLGITPAEADLFQRLAGHLLFAGPALRPDGERIRIGSGRNRACGVRAFPATCRSCCCASTTCRPRRRPASPAGPHYFRLKQFAVDLVIINEHPASYAQELQGALE